MPLKVIKTSDLIKAHRILKFCLVITLFNILCLIGYINISVEILTLSNEIKILHKQVMDSYKQTQILISQWPVKTKSELSKEHR